MLTNRYMTSVKNLSQIMQKIVEGTAPKKFTQTHLKGIGFKSSNDQGIIPVLKDLNFLSADGSPTQRYHDYRDKSQSKVVMAEALREAYADLFHINEHLSESNRSAVEGKFKSTHNTTDRVAREQARTFFALLSLADLSGKASHKKKPKEPEQHEENKPELGPKEERPELPIPFKGFRYNIEVHLPSTKDIEVYNAIFTSLKEHLLGK